MAEAHQSFAAIECLVDPLLGMFRCANLRQLIDDFRRRATMERALERPDRPAHRRRDVRARGRDDPRGEGRRVQAVLGADDEVGVERPRGPGVGTLAIELVEEALDEVERRVRIDRFEAPAEAPECRQCGRREGRERASLFGGRRPGQLLGGAPHGDRGPQRVHRRGVLRQLTKGAHHGLGHRGAGHSHAGVPVTGPQQVRDLGE